MTRPAGENEDRMITETEDGGTFNSHTNEYTRPVKDSDPKPKAKSFRPRTRPHPRTTRTKHKGKVVQRISKEELVQRFPSLKIQGNHVVIPEKRGRMKDSTKKVVTVELDSSELATVLAALREMQSVWEGKDAKAMREAFPDHFHDVKPLGTEDISTLCERINMSPAPVEPIIFCEGGLVQYVLYPVPNLATGEAFTPVKYDMVDYDVFEDQDDKDIAEYFLKRDDTTRDYMKKNLPEEYLKFKKIVDRVARAKRAKKAKKVKS